MPRHADVVILDEENFPPETFVPANFNHFFDQALAHIVVRMGLSGKDDVNRARFVIENPVQTIQIGKQHVAPLVGGKTPGKTDHERRGIDPGKNLFLPGLGNAVFGVLAGYLVTEKIDGPLFHFKTGTPQQTIRNVINFPPSFHIRQVSLPVQPQESVQKFFHPR